MGQVEEPTRTTGGLILSVFHRKKRNDSQTNETMTPPKSTNVKIWRKKKSACGLHLRLRKLNACKYNPNPRNLINLGQNYNPKSLNFMKNIQNIGYNMGYNIRYNVRYNIQYNIPGIWGIFKSIELTQP